MAHTSHLIKVYKPNNLWLSVISKHVKKIHEGFSGWRNCGDYGWANFRGYTFIIIFMPF